MAWWRGARKASATGGDSSGSCFGRRTDNARRASDTASRHPRSAASDHKLVCTSCSFRLSAHQPSPSPRYQRIAAGAAESTLGTRHASVSSSSASGHRLGSAAGIATASLAAAPSAATNATAVQLCASGRLLPSGSWATAASSADAAATAATAAVAGAAEGYEMAVASANGAAEAAAHARSCTANSGCAAAKHSRNFKRGVRTSLLYDAAGRPVDEGYNVE